MAHTPRETAGMTTRLIVAHVRRHAGEAGVERMLELSGVPHPLSRLENSAAWTSYEDKVALLEAASTVLDDPHVGLHAGAAVLEEQVARPLQLLIGSLGTPQQALRSVARAQSRFSTSATMSTIEVRRDGGTVAYRLHPPNVPNRHDCELTQGILSQVSVLFGLPPARIDHPVCQAVDDANECRYVVRWRPRRFRDRFRRGASSSIPFEADALREQLADLQRTVADLVSTPELEPLLHRIADRAAASVRGVRYLLAVQLEGESAPRFHSEGFTPEAAATLGEQLLGGGIRPTDDGRIVAEVRSGQRAYGWLAAELPPGQGFLPTEQEQLDSYGRLAAAALDAATALTEARKLGRATQAVLTLGHELAREDSELEIAERVCEAVPSVLGATRSSLMLWNPVTSALEPAAIHGFGDDRERALGFSIPFAATDAIETVTQEPQALWMTAEDPDPWIRRAVRAFDGSVAASSPILIHGRQSGVLLALWTVDAPPEDRRDMLLDQLSNLADQASTALSAARSLEQARHQATHDPLTGLANRVLFTERIEAALADDRRSGRHTAVCFIDLDGFKGVNDRHGHAVGDQLLVQVGARILACVRESDAVARLSGDEFGVLVRDLEHADAAELVAEKLVAALGDPFEVGDHQLQIGASLGVAVAPAAGDTPDQLLLSADDAMYRAKAHRGTYRIAGEEDPFLDTPARERDRG